jgi:hypothetical protein
MRSTGLGGLSLQSLLLYAAFSVLSHLMSTNQHNISAVRVDILYFIIYHPTLTVRKQVRLTAEELHKRSGHERACNMQDPKLMGRSVMNQGFGIGGLHTTFPVLSVMIIAKLG